MGYAHATRTADGLQMLLLLLAQRALTAESGRLTFLEMSIVDIERSFLC